MKRTEVLGDKFKLLQFFATRETRECRLSCIPESLSEQEQMVKKVMAADSYQIKRAGYRILPGKAQMFVIWWSKCKGIKISTGDITEAQYEITQSYTTTSTRIPDSSRREDYL